MTTDPELLAREAAQVLAARVRNRDLQLRRVFVAREGREQPSPPMARMLRGGQGGRVRLLFYLSLLWVGSGDPHEVTFPARAWAQLLGLPEPETNGARRIRDATSWLEKNRFIRVIDRPGSAPTIRLRKETGRGQPYSVPGAKSRQAKEEGKAVSANDRYVKVPHTFWTEAWPMKLSGPGIAMLLTLLSEAGGQPGKETWFTPNVALNRFDLSEDTRTRGIRDLQEHKLVRVSRRPISRHTFDYQRMRNTYYLLLHNLAPGKEVDEEADEAKDDTDIEEALIALELAAKSGPAER